MNLNNTAEKNKTKNEKVSRHVTVFARAANLVDPTLKVFLKKSRPQPETSI